MCPSVEKRRKILFPTICEMNVIELNEGWSFKQKDTDDEWLPTSVPTKYVESLGSSRCKLTKLPSIHLDLMAHKKSAIPILPTPYDY